MTSRELIGKKVRELRLERGLSAEALGKKVGVSQPQITRIENASTGLRSATLLKLAKALDVPAIHFFTDGEDSSDEAIADEFAKHGLTPSKTLCKQMADPRFRKFIEGCARSSQAHRKNIEKMEKALKRVTAKRRSKKARPKKGRRRSSR